MAGPAVAGAVTDTLPLGVCVPLQAPEAAQSVALIDVHVRVVDAPGATEAEVNVRVGAPGGRVARAASACTNPYPERTLGVGLPIGAAVVRNAVYIWSGVSAEFACNISAAMAAT